MKKERKLNAGVFYKSLIIASLLTAVLFTLPSCGKNKSSAVNQPGVAPETDPVYEEVDEMPLYKDGDKALTEFIKSNIKYPEESKKNGITGRVLVQFVVEKDCSITNVAVIQSVDPLLDAEAARVVGNLPEFASPGKKAGNAVRVQYILPITFALQ